MCGIVAVINKNQNGFTQADVTAFETLLWLDVVRGEDSTGTFLVTNNGDVQIVKSAQHGFDYVRTKEWRAQRNDAYTKGLYLVGHNRKATRGGINDANAHPFWVEDKLVLVHNGTMYGDHKKHADTAVDSHAIAHVLSEEKDVEVALNKVNAAFALIWYDVEEECLKVVRNDERPMNFMETDTAYFLASEASMLRYVAEKHDLKVVKTAEDDGVYCYTPGYMDVFSGEAGSIELKSTKLELNAPTATPWQHASASYCNMSRPPAWTNAYSGYIADTEEDQDIYDRGCHHVSAAPYVPERTNEDYDEMISLGRIAREKANGLHNQNETTYSDWQRCLTNEYKRGTKIRVLLDDELSVEDAKLEMYFVFGTTLDDLNVRVVFGLPRDVLNAVTTPGIKDAIFELEVDSCQWRRALDCSATDFTKHKGKIIVTARKAKLLSTSEGMVC
jgi:predicted glutamine amidotransferase